MKRKLKPFIHFWMIVTCICYFSHNILNAQCKDVEVKWAKGAMYCKYYYSGPSNPFTVHGAVYFNDSARLMNLLTRGKDVNSKAQFGYTPLMAASCQGNLPIVKILVKNGADLNRKESCLEFTSLMFALTNGHEDVSQYLISEGAYIHTKDCKGWTPLMRASQWGFTEIAKILLDNGARIDIQTEDGCTPLIWASRYGSYDIAKTLIEKGAGIQAIDSTGWSALSYAAYSALGDTSKIEAYKGIFQLLMNHDAVIQGLEGNASNLTCTASSYKLLAEMKQENGDFDEAAEYLLIAADLFSRAAPAWKNTKWPEWTDKCNNESNSCYRLAEHLGKIEK